MTITDRVLKIIEEMDIDRKNMSINDLYIFYLKAQIDLLQKQLNERNNEKYLSEIK